MKFILTFYPSLMLIFILWGMASLAPKPWKKIKSTLGLFECGFNLLSDFRLPFSIQYFTIAVLFLIFDLELSVLFPLILSSGMLMIILGVLGFLYILTLGVFLEWKNNLLKWLK